MDDDVRAVVADTLLPIAHFVKIHALEYLPNLLSILWSTLSHLDDLSASTSSIMDLLGN